jgi:hypothetical protein
MMMQRLTKLCAVAAIASAMWTIAADAATISLKRGAVDPTYYPGGYSGAADNTIFYFSAASGANFPSVWMRSSDGANAHTRAINASSNERNLWRFDLSGMSGQNVEVTSDATLTLTSGGGATGFTYKLFQIAAANAGWVESTNNITLNPSSASFPNKSNNGDPTWWYKSIDNATYAGTTGFATSNVQDTTSIPWASGQTSQGNAGSSPEGYANTGGLWNPIDLVDQNPATVASNYLTMGNMDPVASGTVPANGVAVSFMIPKAMVQSWIDNPGSNAGLLGRYLNTATSDFNSSEAGTALRPTLAFDYQTVPEPASVSLLSLGVLLLVYRRR